MIPSCSGDCEAALGSLEKEDWLCFTDMPAAFAIECDLRRENTNGAKRFHDKFDILYSSEEEIQMKKLAYLKKSVVVLLAAALILSATALAEEPTKVLIATEGAYPPYNTVDDEGNPDGYDIAVAKAVDELLDDYEFEYIAVEWSSIFAGLEADRYQVIVSQAAKNEEREAKYLFGAVPYTWEAGAIAFRKGREGITGLGSIGGTDITLSVAVGSSNENTALTWNEEHPDAQLNLVYNDGDISKALLDVQEGRVDATLVSPAVAENVIKAQGLDVDYVLRDEATPLATYWLYSLTDAYGDANRELAAKVDEALQTLIDNGTLAQISEEYLGADYSTEEAVRSRIGGAN